jgi:hypothetical protein
MLYSIQVGLVISSVQITKFCFIFFSLNIKFYMPCMTNYSKQNRISEASSLSVKIFPASMRPKNSFRVYTNPLSSNLEPDESSPHCYKLVL